jgi:hypothetical protein
MKRQKLLFLYSYNSNLDSKAIAWSIYDGAGKEKPSLAAQSPPPYESVLNAMEDGWRVMQIPQLKTDIPGQEYKTSYLEYEYVLEKIEDHDG